MLMVLSQELEPQRTISMAIKRGVNPPCLQLMIVAGQYPHCHWTSLDVTGHHWTSLVHIPIFKRCWHHYSDTMLSGDENFQEGASPLRLQFLSRGDPVLHFKRWVCVCSFLLSQQYFMVSYYHATLRRPTLLCSTCCGGSILVANVVWCCRWSLGLLIMCPDSFLRLFSRIVT